METALTATGVTGGGVGLPGKVIHLPAAVISGWLAGLAPREDDNPALVYLRRLKPSSRITNAKYLRQIATLLSDGKATVESFRWAAIRYQHVVSVQSHFSDRRCAKSANQAVSVIRSVLECAWKMDPPQIDEETMKRATAVDRVEGKPLLTGRHVPPKDMRALFRVAAKRGGNRGARDAAILALLYGTGMRRSELAAIAIADVDLARGKVTVLKGKGDLQRIAVLQPEAIAAVRAWVRRRGTEPGALITRITAYGDYVSKALAPLNDDAIRVIIRKLEREARIERTTPHDFRRTTVSDLLDAGVDVSAGMMVTGHRTPTQFVRYDRRGERAQIRAASKLRVPYCARPKGRKQ